MTEAVTKTSVVVIIIKIYSNEQNSNRWTVSAWTSVPNFANVLWCPIEARMVFVFFVGDWIRSNPTGEPHSSSKTPGTYSPTLNTLSVIVSFI